MTKTTFTLVFASLALLAGASASDAVGLGVHGSGGLGAKVSAAGANAGADVSLTSNASTSGASGTSAISGAATTSSGTSANAGTVVSALASGKGTSIPANIGSSTDVSIVPLSSLKGKVSAKALAQLTTKRAGAIAKLDASVAANPQLMAKLNAAGVQASDVVAVQSGASGAVTVFVNG